MLGSTKMIDNIKPKILPTDNIPNILAANLDLIVTKLIERTKKGTLKWEHFYGDNRLSDEFSCYFGGYTIKIMYNTDDFAICHINAMSPAYQNQIYTCKYTAGIRALLSVCTESFGTNSVYPELASATSTMNDILTSTEFIG